MKYFLIIMAVVSVIVFTFLGTALLTASRLSEPKFLMTQIRNSKAFSSRRYQVNRYTPEEVNVLVYNNDVRSEERPALKEKLTKQKDDVIFFYFEKSYIEYFISHEVNSNQCRLAVMSNHPVLKNLRLPILSNHAVHYIDKEICNGLYGYGRPF